MGSEDVARDAKVGHGYISKSGRVPMRQIGVRAGDLTEGTADEPSKIHHTYLSQTCGTKKNFT